MHEAALKSGEDPDWQYFLHTVRKSSRKLSNYPRRHRGGESPATLDFHNASRIIE
jgi:hypothetical protein